MGEQSDSRCVLGLVEVEWKCRDGWESVTVFEHHTVQNDIMAYLAVNHAGGHQGRCGCMIAPNTKVEFSFFRGRVAYAMIIAGQLGLTTIPNGPVGRVFIIHDRKHMTTPVTNPVAPVIIPGIQLFE